MIGHRQAARKAKNFQQADLIRTQLRAAGFVLEDTAHGTTWKREAV